MTKSKKASATEVTLSKALQAKAEKNSGSKTGQNTSENTKRKRSKTEKPCVRSAKDRGKSSKTRVSVVKSKTPCDRPIGIDRSSNSNDSDLLSCEENESGRSLSASHGSRASASHSHIDYGKKGSEKTRTEINEGIPKESSQISRRQMTGDSSEEKETKRDSDGTIISAITSGDQSEGHSQKNSNPMGGGRARGNQEQSSKSKDSKKSKKSDTAQTPTNQLNTFVIAIIAAFFAREKDDEKDIIVRRGKFRTNVTKYTRRKKCYPIEEYNKSCDGNFLDGPILLVNCPSSASGNLNQEMLNKKIDSSILSYDNHDTVVLNFETIKKAGDIFRDGIAGYAQPTKAKWIHIMENVPMNKCGKTSVRVFPVMALNDCVISYLCAVLGREVQTGEDPVERIIKLNNPDEASIMVFFLHAWAVSGPQFIATLI